MKKWMVAAASVVLVLGLAFWGHGYYQGRAKVDRAKTLQAELISPDTAPEARREKMDELRKEMDELDDEQRDEVFKESPMHKAIDAYFTLPESERPAYLDEQIDKMETMRRQFRSRREGEGAESSGPREEGERRGGRRGFPRGSMTEQDRMQWRKKMLDRTTPEQRAKFTKFFSDLRARMKERRDGK